MKQRIPTEDLVADKLSALRGMAEARRQLLAQAVSSLEQQMHERVLAEYERRIHASH
ncbi:MAG: hypothetical protein U1F33_13430 [Alphaproteobacteria bacterium]